MKKISSILKYQWLMVMVAAMAMSISLSACGNDDDDNDTTGSLSNLPGKWETSLSYSSGQTWHAVYQFYTNGTGYFYEYTDDTTSTEADIDYFNDYKVENGHLYILWDGDNEYDDEAIIRSLTPETMILGWDDSQSTLTFHKVSNN
jgi:hypothetical protein